MKVVLVGDTQVGKTCMLNRLITKSFKDSTNATVGAAFQTHVVATENGCVTMQIWDTAGQEKYRALAPMYYRSANVAIICYDITNAESFKAADVWASELAQKAPSELQVIIAGTKADLENDRAVSKEEGRKFAETRGASDYIECSAKTGENVVAIFTKAAEIGGPQLMVKESRPGGMIVMEQKAKPQGKCC